MTKILNFPQSEHQHGRHLDKWVTDIISQHPNKDIATRWAAMASTTCQRFPSAPWPTQETLALDAVNAMDESTREIVLNALQEFMQSYFTDVNNQLMEVHRELLVLQKRICELESERR